MTSKLQITLPKALASKFGIKPGDEIEWRAASDRIHLVPPPAQRHRLSAEERLELFDRATERATDRVRADHVTVSRAAERGWTREDLYDRDRSR
ncbi:MAG: AbrB/MazE/SpoVT family DNA-binding domain-containing protein [Deltaproteobacteria bacterium]|nr:AbrB/MazE/SpoVT family DNA-binding domain-containing protein [Deltaproteobacteria bacterium]